MKQVKQIRQHITNYVLKLRSYVSMTEGNSEVVERLRGEEGEKRIARIVGFVLKELGHEANTPVEAPASHIRRAISRVRGPKGSKQE